MYGDLSRIEEMVSTYLELDEEDQKIIQQKVLELSAKSVHKQAVLKEQAQIPEKQRLSDKEIEEEICARTIERLKGVSAFADMFDKFQPDQKAAMFIALASFQKKKPKVRITVSNQKESTRKLIEELIPEADYENARRIYRETLRKIDGTGQTHE